MSSWTKYFDADTIARLSQIGFKPSGLVEGNLVGNHRSPFHGFAIEFAGHRGYVPGDDVRHIDWTAYYKTDKYLIKQYEQETNFVAHILIDVSESMKFEYQHGSKMAYAAFIATSLGQIIVGQSDQVGAHFFANAIVDEIPVSGGMEVVAKISTFCEKMELKSPSAIGTVLRLLGEKIGRRRVVFVISDLFGDLDATFDGVKRLLDGKHEIVLLQIVDPLELSFNLQGRVRLIELEGQERLDLIGAAVKESYEKLFHDYLDELRNRALTLGIDYIQCDMSRPFGFHLAEYLSGRARGGK